MSVTDAARRRTFRDLGLTTNVDYYSITYQVSCYISFFFQIILPKLGAEFFLIRMMKPRTYVRAQPRNQ